MTSCAQQTWSRKRGLLSNRVYFKAMSDQPTAFYIPLVWVYKMWLMGGRVRSRVLAWFDFELNTTVLAEADKQKSSPIHCTLHHYQCCITYLHSVSFEMMQLLNYLLELKSNFLINCIFQDATQSVS